MPETPQEWIEHNKKLRVAEGVSLAEQEMTRVLAEQVLTERLGRAHIVGTTSKGRVIVEYVGEKTPAEQKWAEMLAKTKRQPTVVKGGPHIGKEM